MSLQDTVLAMTVAVMEVAKTGRDALIDQLIEGGLTGEEAQTVVDDVILVRLGPGARKAKVQQLHDAGMSQRQIAAEVGVSKTSVQRDLGPFGPPANMDLGPFGPETGHETALTPAEVKGPSFERTFRSALRNFRNDYAEFAARPKYAAMFAAIDEVLKG